MERIISWITRVSIVDRIGGGSDDGEMRQRYSSADASFLTRYSTTGIRRVCAEDWELDSGRVLIIQETSVIWSQSDMCEF